MKRLRLIGLVPAVAVLGGCGKPSAAAPGTSGPAAGAAPVTVAATAAGPSRFVTLPGRATTAQPKLPGTKMGPGQEDLVTELARSPVEVGTGMMVRTNMAEHEAVIFVLPYVQQATFWMANCPHPLSLAYINTEGVIEEIHPLDPFNT